MSIINLTIADVGMWVTPMTLLRDDRYLIFLELSTFKHQTNNAFRSISSLNRDALKTEKRPILTTNRFSLQAGILSRLNAKLNKKTIGP